MSEADDFFALSQLLTGEHSLDRQVSEAYLGRLRAAFPDALSALLASFRAVLGATDPGDALMTEIAPHPDQAEAARQTVIVWYTSQFTKPDKSSDPPGDASQYRSALLWKVIRAHVPAVSPAPYGHWEFM